MDVQVDHYEILGLPSGEQGAKLSDQDINKAYRSKARELHPDKRRDDQDAHTDFLNLQASYQVLKDQKARKLFDDLLRVKREKLERLGQQDSKRRKMMSDLEERESAFAMNPTTRDRDEEERISKKLKEEIARIRAMHTRKMGPGTTPFKQDTTDGNSSMGSSGVPVLDKDKTLKVSWEKTGKDYTAQRLKEIFQEFGAVEDVVIRSLKKKKRGSALVVMASKDDAIAATGNVLGDLSNPLLVFPLQPASSPPVFSAERDETDVPNSNLVGAGHRAFEESVLDKLKKAAQKRK